MTYIPRRARLRCPICFRLIGVSRHDVITYHKNPVDGRKCLGIGCYGGAST